MPDMIMLPREPGQRLVTEYDFRRTVSARLSEIRGIDFPSSRTDLDHQTSWPLVSIPGGPSLEAFLRGKNCLITQHSDSFLVTLRRGPTWLVRGSIVLVEQWKETRDGVRVVLSTRPTASGGDERDTATLASYLKDFWSELGANVLELIKLEGKKDYSWEELGIEPSVSVEEFFGDFVNAFQGNDECVGKYLRDLADNDEFSPFKPDPIIRGAKSLHTGNVFYSGRVPKSAQKSLLRAWYNQAVCFGKAHLPQTEI